MTERRCSIDGCEATTVARGWCSMHYKRWQRYGDTSATRPTPEERFWRNVDKDGPGGCWLWTGYIEEQSGYGRLRVNGDRWMAHRFSYELLVGPIPAGLHLDHVWALGCRHRHCVNPAHLEPVTPRENIARSEPARRDHCVNGHPFTPENTMRDKRKGWRSCRECAQAASRRYVARKRAVAA